MATEKRLTLKFAINKGGLDPVLEATRTEDFTGKNYQAYVKTVTTSWTAIDVSMLGSVDLIAIRNTDATNFIQVALDNAGAKIFAKITAGRGMFLCGESTATYYYKADTASCDVEVLACEP
jgi:hypothetical protein